MKPVIIYHDHCTDGFGAAFCAWQKFKDDAFYIPLNYGQVNTVADMNSVLSQAGVPSEEATDLFILDFSLPKEVMKWLVVEFNEVVWLDHHKTAFEVWCGEDYLTSKRQLFTQSEIIPLSGSKPVTCHIVLDNNKSGAMLAWEYFNPAVEPPDFIKWIDDRDRWQFKFNDSKSFHAGMEMLKPWSFQQWSDCLTVEYNVTTSEDIVRAGDTVLAYKDQQISSLVKYARDICIPSNEHPELGPSDNTLVTYNCFGKAVNSPVHMSEIGHVLATETGAFGTIWYLGQDNKVKVSLRSNGDYDVSKIAKTYGGGGHKNASGFAIDVQTFLGWLK